MPVRKQVRGQVSALYELLCLHSPFAGQSTLVVVYMIAKTVACALLGVTLVGVLCQTSKCKAAEPPPPGKAQDNPPDKNKRGTPSILSPTEGRVDVALTQVKCYVIAPDGDHGTIMKLSGVPTMGSDFICEMIPISEITKLNQNTEHFADTIQPTRMAVIVASFPYQKQLQEFKDQLHLKTDQDVVNETTPSKKTPNEKAAVKPRYTFSFLSPLVQRRLVDVHGEPLGEWKSIDLVGKQYRDLLRANGMRFAPELPKLDTVCFDGLVMSKMALLGKNQYPEGEKSLADLQKTLNLLADSAKKGEAPVKPKSPFSTEGLDPFSKQRPNVDPKIATYVVPEYCLIRLIDVTVEPGKLYQYRIKVRMANPNLGMKNVAKAADATRTEPLESEWFEIRPKKDAKPQIVAMPQEYHLYTVDQQEIDNAQGKRYSGQNFGVSKDRQVTFQIHKWVEYTDENPTVPCLAIGEWSVAERVLAYRGEYIGRKQRVEMPYWRPTKEMFVLARDPGKKNGLEMDFGPRTPDGTPPDSPYFPILVDFDGGPLTYRRIDGKDRDGKDVFLRINEKPGVETLILSPDGKLLAENSWTDKADPKRVKRLEEWRKRIDDVRNAKDTSSGTPGGSDPFNPKKMP